MLYNVGKIDRLIRLVAALALMILYLARIIDGTTGQVLVAAAGMLAFTSFQRTCPFYALFRLGTCRIQLKEGVTKAESKQFEE